MRFDKNRKPPPYLSRREQWRMLGLVAALCLVLVAIQWAANPDNWRWFTELGDGPEAATVEELMSEWERLEAELAELAEDDDSEVE